MAPKDKVRPERKHEPPQKKQKRRVDVAHESEQSDVEADGLFADVTVNVEGETFEESASALAAGSRVFRAMLQSQMKEGVTKTIDLADKAAEEYKMFRQFFRSHAAVGSHSELLTVENVDRLLPWFHEYQMSKMLRECEQLLMGVPVTTARLVQAHTYDLKKQYRRALHAVAQKIAVMEVAGLEEHPQIIADLLPFWQSQNKHLRLLAGC
eukprot:TRINITY_DN111328_c0_g1_i1.p1 TRINITY_DN111328_c0_g1~~TRINITY_DN111328_c0_g1_i1.p1  ORF type:complete len:210 (-),score=47.41 TRINITY_DN111328_c0_g1_i1:273-902(-)